MSKTKTEVQRLADEYADATSTHRLESLYGTSKSYTAEKARERDEAHAKLSAELRRLDAIAQRHIEMMANPCPEWDGKAYMQAIANLRAQLDQAVAEEREACALECESRQANGNRTHTHPDECAAAIRARSNT